MPTAEEIRLAIMWWQTQDACSLESHLASVALVELLCRVVEALPAAEGPERILAANGDR